MSLVLETKLFQWYQIRQTNPCDHCLPFAPFRFTFFLDSCQSMDQFHQLLHGQMKQNEEGETLQSFGNLKTVQSLCIFSSDFFHSAFLCFSDSLFHSMRRKTQMGRRAVGFPHSFVSDLFSHLRCYLRFFSFVICWSLSVCAVCFPSVLFSSFRVSALLSLFLSIPRFPFFPSCFSFLTLVGFLSPCFPLFFSDSLSSVS